TCYNIYVKRPSPLEQLRWSAPSGPRQQGGPRHAAGGADADRSGWRARPTGSVDWSRVNVNGSSVAVGHPWAATGGRILTTLAYEMARRATRRGLISIWAADDSPLHEGTSFNSLLLALLPVFAGVPGADHLFAITCLVVLLSVLVHGGGIAIYLRR